MFFQVIILAIVQGLTEFLPVSSSGHLVLLNNMFSIGDDFLLLSVVLHVATLFSVLVVLKKEVIEIIKHPFGSLSKKLIIATIPTVFIVLLLKTFIKNSFSGTYLPFCFMLTATLIVLSEIVGNKKDKEITNATVIIMGIAQGLAVFPGISRSGSTICSGLICGANKKDVAVFSFLMSVPIIFASLFFEIFEYVSSGQHVALLWYEILAGFFVAFATGIFAVKILMKMIQNKSFVWFAVYLVFVAIFSFFII